MILILTTFPKKSEAVKIGKVLLKQKLIACFNLLSVQSGYRWRGKIVNEKEFLMIIKTKEENFDKIEACIKNHHSYMVSEIVAIKAASVNKPYLSWLEAETK